MFNRLTRNIMIGLIVMLGVFALHANGIADTMKAQIKQVKSSEVCMVNNTVMAKPQIPVEFEGKTYYGCCAGCVSTLKTDRSARYSEDPVSGKEIDKAKAVIVEGVNGSALYFESVDTAQRYKEAGAAK